jgi:hypothetical protein
MTMSRQPRTNPASTRPRKLRLQDKGQRGLMLRFIEAIRGTAQPAITWDDLLLSTRLTLCARESLTTGKPVAVGGGVVGSE